MGSSSGGSPEAEPSQSADKSRGIPKARHLSPLSSSSQLPCAKMAESCCSTSPLTATRMRAAAASTPTIAASASALKRPMRSRLLRLSSSSSSSSSLQSFVFLPPVRYRCISSFKMVRQRTRAQASSVGAGSYGGEGEADSARNSGDSSRSEITSQGKKPLSGVNYQLSIAGVLLVSAIAFSLVVFLKGGPTALIAALAKSGFTAAFTLIFVSEIGDKTFFIAALLAMQYDKAMVLLGSMGALSLMTILSVIIGRIFNSVPAQFQTTLPIGEYAAVALLAFFGLKSIKNAWELPSNVSANSKESSELGEFVEAEELVKEKVATMLTSPFEVLWKSFSLVFFAEWGDRSMLATIALGAAQSPWGVAGGAIAGHLVATTIAIIGGAFLANYISEKLVGYLGGILFLVFAVATLLGVF